HTRFSRDWSSDVCSSDLAVGHITLIDADDLCLSNTNRQLPALAGEYGRNKAEAMATRCRAISPAISLDVVQMFLTPGNLADLLRSEERRVGTEWSSHGAS